MPAKTKKKPAKKPEPEAKKKPRQLEAKELNWQTPPRVVDPIRGFCGGQIALDPCTEASNHLGARYLYTVTDDGLLHDWSPTPEQQAEAVYLDMPWVVFVNPPYGKFIHPWLAKIREQARAGVTMLVLLQANRYEQAYLTDVLKEASAICYIRKRVGFLDPKTGQKKNANMGASVLWGFNVDLARFDAAFRELGACFAHMQIPSPIETIRPISLEERAQVESFAAGNLAIHEAEEASGGRHSVPVPEEDVPRLDVAVEEEPLPADPYCDGEEDARQEEPAYFPQVMSGAREPAAPILCGVCAASLVDGSCPAGHDHATSTRRRLPTAILSSSPPGIPDLELWKMDVLKELDGRPVVVSVSGGKDSVAVCLLLKEAGIPYRSIHMDTGWENDLTVDYVRNYLPGVIGEIEVLQSHHGGMEELVRKKGMFPSRVRRFCTQELKVRPFIRYLRKLQKEGLDPVNAVGIRRAESKARSELAVWEDHKDFDCTVWRPIAFWTEADVIAMHHRHGVKPNPLYLLGASRVGCWPCIFARKQEIRMIAHIDPERIETMRQLEVEVRDAAAARYAEKGETFESLGYQLPTWFPNPTSRTNKTTGKRAGEPWPIDDVVAWANTKRGGKEDELLEPGYAEEGCMRWGLCETVDPETERANAAKFDGLVTVAEQKAAVLAELAAASADPALDGFM